MHARRWMPFVAIGLAVPLLAFHLTLKRRPKPEEVAELASRAARPGEWQGRIAPDFELTTLEGEVYRLSDHVGKEAIVLNFFATWCAPCREEMPELERLMQQNASRPIRLLAIDVDEKRDLVEAFVKQQRLALPVAVDESGGIGHRFGVDSYPTTVVVGADGRIVLHQSGAITNVDVSLRPAVDEIVARIARGEGTTREAYLAAAKSEVAPRSRLEKNSVHHLTGRALQIAQRMACPCGCSDKVADCGCATAKAIAKRLSGDLGSKTDEEVMRELNREFCMKGM